MSPVRGKNNIWEIGLALFLHICMTCWLVEKTQFYLRLSAKAFTSLNERRTCPFPSSLDEIFWKSLEYVAVKETDNALLIQRTITQMVSCLTQCSHALLVACVTHKKDHCCVSLWCPKARHKLQWHHIHSLLLWWHFWEWTRSWGLLTSYYGSNPCKPLLQPGAAGDGCALEQV